MIGMTSLNGLLILDKTSGWTCAREVDAVKRVLPWSTKVGHAGTLDPFASGILILLLGKSTRRCEEIMSWPKIYEATIKLGATTITDDPKSPEQPREAHPVNLQSIESALTRFVGNVSQRPPIYSALKIKGRRASDRVRAGGKIELEPRTVFIHEITLISYIWPRLTIRVRCGRGTYIRSIARDLGEALGVGGYVMELRRTQIGSFGLDRAVKLDQLTKDNVKEFIVS
jgi:tRNA pseudouridine55 synthase